MKNAILFTNIRYLIMQGVRQDQTPTAPAAPWSRTLGLQKHILTTNNRKGRLKINDLSLVLNCVLLHSSSSPNSEA